MSDPAQPPPPKPKPGSLRDRIAAFEKPASPSSSTPKPPPIRPKPGNVSWKPAPPSPTANTTTSATPENEERNHGGMSATDAKQSIGKGGSLKERMAALQGKGAFGGGAPSPSPPPVGPKPAKRPPLVVSPPPVEEKEEEKELGEPKPVEKQEGEQQEGEQQEGERHEEKDAALDTAGDNDAAPKEEKEEPVEEEQDEEAKERERRAAIAARMARLGGARVGMSPPVFGKKPDVKPKPKDVPAPEEESKATSPPVTAETGPAPVRDDSKDSLMVTEPTAPSAEEATLSPEPIEPSTEIPRIITDEEATSKDSIAQLPQSPLSSSTSPSDSRPNLGPSASQTSLTSSRSPPSSMPIPAAPRRAGPPKRKSARNIKAEAKKQDQELPEMPSVPSEAPAEPTQSPAVPSESEQEPFILAKEEHDEKEAESVLQHDASEPNEAAPPVDEPAVTISEDSEEHAAPPPPVRATQEVQEVQEVPKSPEDAVREPTDAVSPVQPADAPHSPEPDTEVNPSTAEVVTPESAESKEPKDTTPPSVDEPELHGQPEPEVAVSDERPVVEDVTSPGHDVGDTTPVDRSPQLSPVVETGALISEPAGLVSAEPEAETAATQEPEQHEAAATEDETEDDEAARRKRIAERMAKMGGRNPFAAGPFGAAAPAKKVSGDEPLEPTPREPSSVRKDNQDIVPEHEAMVESKSHEAEDPGPRVMGVAQEQDDDVPLVEGSLSEHEATELEHKTTSQVLASSGPEEHPETTSPVEESQSTEEAEMAPPRITRAVPPPPPQTSLDESAVSPIRTDPKRVSSRESIPPAPRESTSIVHDPFGVQDEKGGVSEEQGITSNQMQASPTVRDSISVTSPKDEKRRETDQASPLSPTSRRSMPPPPRAVPVVPPAAGSPEFRSPISPISSRRSIPPPPQIAPVPPGGDDRVDRDPSASLVSARRAASPPARAPPVPQSARPVSPEPESAVSPPPSTRRSIPPPPRPAPSQPTEEPTPRPPRRASSQLAEEVFPPAPRRAPSQPAEETVDANSHSRTTTSAVSDIEPINRDSIEEQEVLADSDPDPIDPSFYSPPRSPAIAPSPREQHQPSFTFSATERSSDAVEVDAEQARRRTIAERMAKLGGLRFGAPPPVILKPPASLPEKSPREETATGQEAEEEGGDAGTEALYDEPMELEEQDSEETERARRQVIATRLAGMGGMRFGMLPQMSAPAHPRARSDDSARTAEVPRPPPQRSQPPPPPESTASEGDLQSEGQSVSDEGVKVEAESETSMEEVNAEDAEEDPEEIPPPVPSRPSRQSHVPTPEVAPPLPGGRRPPVPVSALPTRPPIPKVEPKRSSVSSSSRKASGPSGAPLPPPGDFVIVDDPTPVSEELPPPPPPRARPPRGMPPPAPPPPPPAPASVSPSKDMGNSLWELPDIPSGSFDLNVGAAGHSMDASISSEDSTTYPPTPSASSHARPAESISRPTAPVAQTEVQLSSDQLLQLWGTVGTAVHAVASSLFDKSKKSLVGDGTSQGFVNATLAQVPQASKASYGHLIYSQDGNKVLRRSSNIMPGDIVQLTEAKLKGHKGLQSYHQTAGTAQEPLVGIVSEFDGKKSKVKVYQANQHVGAQTVETASYRLDDLKNGNVKVFRVASA